MKLLLLRNINGPDVRQLGQALADALKTDASAFPNLGKSEAMDANMEAAARRWQSGVGLVADGVMGPYCQILLGLRQPAALEIPLTVDTVRRLFPATKPANIARYLPYVTAALSAVGLTDRLALCAAMGTIRAETEGFLPISEFQSQFNTAPGGLPFGLYDSSTKIGIKLGNKTPGDGARFKGRGFVQLTGRDNYTRYSAALGMGDGLVNTPDLANAPEVAALLLAQFISDKATAMRIALIAGDHAKARKLVNGGSHGLERFRSVFELAQTVWPLAPSVSASKRKARAGAVVVAQNAPAAAPRVLRSLTVRKDPIDLNDRAYQPPPVGLCDVWPSNALIKAFLPAYTQAGLVLDQGNEGACTGFGLACVVNYLHWVKAGTPATFASVSPRMFYNFARRYDEYEGENYSGSSCRGAIKGWFHHGVCMEQDWPYAAPQPSYGFAEQATKNTLGVYYRIDLKSITDVQAAIQAVGAVYVSAFTHEGWHTTPNSTKAPSGHGDIPVIPFDGRPSKADGHAFALVGFNAQGFVVQNSWGCDFGMGGFAVLSYADWLVNSLDAWVVALGVPGVVMGRLSVNAAQSRAGVAGGANTSQWWCEAQAYQHSVVLGDDGRIKRYLTQDELSRTLGYQACDLPDQWFRTPASSTKKRLVIYAHGGLNSEEKAVQRAQAMGRHFLNNGCYPIFLVWKTGLSESLGNIIHGRMGRAPQPALAGGVREWITEQTDTLLEKTLGRPIAKPIWSEMQQNAAFAYTEGRGGIMLINALKKLIGTWGNDLEIHLIGHSAGSIMLGHMLTALRQQRMPNTAVKSIHLYAPACTVDFANVHYAVDPETMSKLHLRMLSDRVERNDNVAAIYRKSLLYFVSNALEADLRTPIAGMAKVYDPASNDWDGSSSTGNTLKNWRQALEMVKLQPNTPRFQVLDDDKVVTALATATDTKSEIPSAHGSFDNDVNVITQTLEVITGAALVHPVDDLRGF